MGICPGGTIFIHSFWDFLQILYLYKIKLLSTGSCYMYHISILYLVINFDFNQFIVAAFIFYVTFIWHIKQYLFCVLILYPATLLNSLIISLSFLVGFQRFSTNKKMQIVVFCFLLSNLDAFRFYILPSSPGESSQDHVEAVSEHSLSAMQIWGPFRLQAPCSVQPQFLALHKRSLSC